MRAGISQSDRISRVTLPKTETAVTIPAHHQQIGIALQVGLSYDNRA